MGECSSAKEVVIAAQESIERLETSLDEDDEDENDASDKRLPLPSQLITLIGLYASGWTPVRFWMNLY
jgi:hypothetical protein